MKLRRRLNEAYVPWVEGHAETWWNRARAPARLRASKVVGFDANLDQGWDEATRWMDAETLDRAVRVIGSYGAIQRIAEALMFDLRAMETDWPKYVEKGLVGAGDAAWKALKAAVGMAEDLADAVELPAPKKGVANPFQKVVGQPLPGDRDDLADRVGSMRDEVMPKLIEVAVAAKGLYPSCAARTGQVAAGLKTLYDALRTPRTSEDREMSDETWNDMRRLAGVTEEASVTNRVLNRMHQERPRQLQVELLVGKIDPRSAALLADLTSNTEALRQRLHGLHKAASDLAAIEPGEADDVKDLLLAAIDKVTQASATLDRLSASAQRPT